MPATVMSVFVYAFCEDLTDPNSVPEPISFLAFGGADNQSFWAHVTKADAGDRYCPNDPIGCTVLNNLTESYSDVINGMFAQNLSIPAMIKYVYNETGHSSLHIAADLDVIVEYEDDLAAAVLKSLKEAFTKLNATSDPPDLRDDHECGFFSTWDTLRKINKDTLN